jgi:hypothetical protein
MSKVNSVNKKNIAFAAMGNYQVEFFDIDGDRYFAAYVHSGIEGQNREVLFRLSEVLITNMGSNGYQISFGKKLYKFTFEARDNEAKAQFTEYLWQWLPFQRFRGNISNAGLATIEGEFGAYVNSVV